MKNIKFLFISFFISSNVNAQSVLNGVILEEYNEVLTTGINPVTNELIEGSDWVLKKTAANRTTCSEFTEEIYLHTQVGQTKIEYINKSNSCSPLTIPEDVDGVITFSDLGIVQETFFDVDTLTCGVGFNCEINQNIEYSNQYYSSINPTRGLDGTSAGNVDVMVYNLKNINNVISDGSGGTGGVANLPYNPQTVNYCVNYRDVSTDGRNSVYAKNPLLEIKVINWKPFNEGPSQPKGLDTTTKSRSFIMRGIDSTNRYLIGLDNIINP